MGSGQDILRAHRIPAWAMLVFSYAMLTCERGDAFGIEIGESGMSPGILGSVVRISPPASNKRDRGAPDDHRPARAELINRSRAFSTG